ncbi:protein KINESIN LIGHT CHAIN-RELATED 1 [Prunus yedoensis var. nudiflora]|uniref:Protein KINESIN LIGHT CHAIN-RELATED 1 n=1 Tax=Prunus yedoensis var. nudiflora TaxID=2094558 RepID=A0A314ZSN2_PRUYE|nr:protein KINESIN LIGHT CHAIN-RELATED 1 [Prunus yedoensis var. nudiflora]
MPVLASPKPSQTIFVPDPTFKIEHSNGTKTPSPSTSRTKASRKTQPVDETSLDNPDLGPFLLKLARDTFGSGESPNKSLDYAIRASKSFERCSGPGLDLAMSLHVVAAIYCSLGRFEEAVRVLERAIEVSDPENGPDHALAKFSGYMQLGDTCSMLGQLEQSILCYESGLKIQRETLGGSDPRVAETCRYLAEAHVQVMQFDEAENYCKKTLEIRKEHSSPASVEEAADRRLMALIYEAKGDYESALEHLGETLKGTTPLRVVYGHRAQERKSEERDSQVESFNGVPCVHYQYPLCTSFSFTLLHKGNWKSAYIALRHLNEFLSSNSSPERKYSTAEYSICVPQIPLSRYIFMVSAFGVCRSNFRLNWDWDWDRKKARCASLASFGSM